jgi:hypothetical protein
VTKLEVLRTEPVFLTIVKSDIWGETVDGGAFSARVIDLTPLSLCESSIKL